MEELRKLGNLPGRVVKDLTVDALIRKRIRSWRDKIFPQLDANGLFIPDSGEVLVGK